MSMTHIVSNKQDFDSETDARVWLSAQVLLSAVTMARVKKYEPVRGVVKWRAETMGATAPPLVRRRPGGLT